MLGPICWVSVVMSRFNKFFVGGIGIAVGLLVSVFVIKIQGNSPAEVYRVLFDYSIASSFSWISTLDNTTPLILTGLSAAIAWRAGAINLGQPGQFLMGAIVAALLGIYLPFPGWISIPVILTASALGGALWSGFAALMRQRYGMDEFVSTLMLNFIAEYSTTYLVTYPFLDPKAYVASTVAIKKAFTLSTVNQFNEGFYVAVAVAVVSWWVVEKWRIGYEWEMMGLNLRFARVGGCKVSDNYMWVMLYSGALSGLAGGLLILGGTQHRFMKGIGGNFGWDGVMLAMIGNNDVSMTALFALFFGALKSGGIGMEFETGVPSEFIMVMEAVIVVSVVATRSVIEFYGGRVKAFLKARKVVKR